MKVLLGFIFICLVTFINYSCENLVNPKGYIGAEDEDSPEINLIEPVNNQEVIGHFYVRFTVKDFTGIRNISVKLNNNPYYRIELLSSIADDTLTYLVDVSSYEGNYTVNISVTDESDNVASKSVDINVTPLIIQELPYSSTNNNHIRDIKEDRTGTLWFAMQSGLYEYSGTSFITEPQGFDLPRPSVASIAVDSENKLWMVYRQNYNSEGPRLVCFTGSEVIHNIYMPNSPRSYGWKNFYFDLNDTLWGMLGSDGYFTYMDSIWNLNHTYPETYFSFLIDKSGRKWAATSKGIKYKENNTWYNTNFPAAVIGILYMDYSGNIWVYNSYEENKMYKYAGSSWFEYSLLPEGKEIRAATFDNNGFIWISGNGYLFKFNTEGILVVKYYFSNSPEYLFCDSRNNIWMGQEWGIYRLNANVNSITVYSEIIK